MQVYLVGGAVRDGLLGLVVKDKDYVVVGATPDELLSQGFQQVGADFPVFLHPKNHTEYALARQERKIGVGHKAFFVQSDTNVSLKEDLLRRDLTINALAMPVAGLFDETIIGTVVDYYGGLQDLQNKQLRHISPAFSEDPLRVLRVARFYARFYEFGFVIADDTQRLMQQIAQNGELASLSRERLWAESVKAMAEKNAFAYWQCLYELQILGDLLPTLNAKWQQTAPIYAVLNQHNRPIYWQFAMLMSAFFADDNPKIGIDDCAKRFCVPKLCVKFAHLVAEFWQDFKAGLTAQRVFVLIKQAYRADNAKFFWQVVQACYVYWYYYFKEGVLSDVILEDITHLVPIQVTQQLNRAILAYHSVSYTEVDSHLKGRQIGDAIDNLRRMRIKNALLSIDDKKHKNYNQQ